jgi:hypothetical protein
MERPLQHVAMRPNGRSFSKNATVHRANNLAALRDVLRDRIGRFACPARSPISLHEIIIYRVFSKDKVYRKGRRTEKQI